MPFINVFLEDDLHHALKALSKNIHRPIYQIVPNLVAEGVVRWEAVAEEGTGVIERAAPNDSAEGAERATSRESTVEAERAFGAEGPVSRERAVNRESPAVDERAAG